MSLFVLTRDQVRDVDRRAAEDFGLPGVVLMENAGRGAAELLVSLGIHGRVVVCSGGGNNGGDGFVLARHLDNLGFPVRVLLFAEPGALTGDAAVHYQVLARAGVPIEVHAGAALDETTVRHELDGAEWIVDALFGTGLRGALRPPFDRLVAWMNESPGRRYAIDVPSGLDCDTGRAFSTAVRADHTVTFVANKLGFADPAARAWLGQVHVVDIGVPRKLVAELLRS